MSSALAAAPAVRPAAPAAARRSRMARTGTLLVAGAACLGLTACGARFDPVTYGDRDQGNSSNATVGVIDVRNASVLSPEEGALHEAGGSAELTLHLVNSSAEADTLVEVATDAAGSVELREDGRPVREIEVPAKGVVSEDIEVELADLTRDLRSGEYVKLTLTFETNGETTFLVPVATPTNPEDREHSENVHAEEE